MSYVAPAPGSSSRRRLSQLVGQEIGGRYRILRMIGTGGMSAVYEAEEKGTRERVALKILQRAVLESPDSVDRFVQESLAVALVHHPNVVRSLGAFEDGEGAPVIVLELLQGKSLDKVIKQEAPLAIGRAVRITIEAAEGVAAVHEKGIVHRDLKPGNIFLTRGADGEPAPVKVLDFGVSMLRDPLVDESASRRTGGGEILGTPQYMAPEQVHDARAADERSDVYALGAILFEMLAGWAPFRAKTYPMLIVEILTATPPSLTEHRADCPPELADVIERALAKDPDARWPSMRAFIEALRPFTHLDGPVPDVRPPTPEPTLREVIERGVSLAPPAARPAKTDVAKWLLIAAVILLALAVLIYTAQ